MDLEKAVTLNREIEFFAGGSKLTLGENFGGGNDAGTVTDLDAGGELVTAAVLSTRCPGLLVKHILKFDLAPFEATRVHVREIVGDRVQVELLGLHARGS